MLKINVYISRLALIGAALVGNAAVAGDIQPPPSIIGSLTAGFGHACAVQRYLATDQTWQEHVLCWGDNSFGELGSRTGDASTNYVQPVPTVVGPILKNPMQGPAGTVTQLAAGDGFTCALKTDGTVWCWGDDSYGEIGIDPFPNNAHDPAVAAISWPSYASIPMPQRIHINQTANPIVRITAGSSFACAVDSAGAVFCWGDNSNDELQQPNNKWAYSATPFTMGHLTTPVTQIAAGKDFVCALDSNANGNDGAFWCWGNGSHGSLGDANPSLVGNVYIPVRGAIPLLGHGVTGAQLIATYHSACLLDTTGTDWCWGDNSYGELGVGVPLPDFATSTPTKASTTIAFTAIWGGSEAQTDCATASSGLYCTGYSSDDLFDRIPMFDPSRWISQFVATPTQVANGGDFSCAVTMVTHHPIGGALWTTQNVVCWGNDMYGQLGNALPVGSTAGWRTLQTVL